jgi:hypothetical protein
MAIDPKERREGSVALPVHLVFQFRWVFPPGGSGSGLAGVSHETHVKLVQLLGYGPQSLTRDGYREVYHSFCNIVGGVLSPLLANLLLDDLDKELERRGHCFCRYADDCNIYVRTQKAGDWVLSSVTRFLEEKLRLRVNQKKSGAAPVQERQFLGYRILQDGRLVIAPRSLERAKRRIRQITRRN